MTTPATPDLALVIMAGGAGTRFWPVSTEERPKQFLRLFGERTLLQLSYDRVAALAPPERTLVLTNARFVPLVREQLPELPPENVIGEPQRRDTAAAVALAALLCQRRHGDPVMAVLTADHLIRPPEVFQAALRSAARAARAAPAALYTFGIRPSFPATGYGYLQRGAALADADPAASDVPHYRLRCFREKPDAPTAERYVASGEYYWNSGMFVWTTGAILAQLRRHLPEHVQHLERAAAADGTPGWDEALRDAFQPLPLISVDFGVMEKAEDVRCVVTDFEWNDVGGWLALEPFLTADGEGNTRRGALHHHDAAGNLVFCEDADEAVALIGVRDLVVVRAGKKTLVVPKSRAEEIKQLVARLDPRLR